jgi:hypothetical protein
VDMNFSKLEDKTINWFLLLLTVIFLIYDIKNVWLTIYIGKAKFSSLSFNLTIGCFTTLMGCCCIYYFCNRDRRAVTAGLFITYLRVLISIVRQLFRALNYSDLQGEERIKFVSQIVQGSMSSPLWMAVLAFLCYTRIQNRLAKTIFLWVTLIIGLISALSKLWEMGYILPDFD